MIPEGITVRRAQASDAESIANFVNRALQGQTEIDKQTVLERLGSVGFLLAEQSGVLIGIVGWQVENLVARVTDFLVYPPQARQAAGQVLFAEMESSAMDLQGEVAMLFLPYPVSSDLIEFCQSLGYESQILTSLPKAWQEAAQEAMLDEEGAIMVRRLRSDRVIHPL